MDRGYCETRFLDHKTARPGIRRALPVVASAFGVAGQPRAAQWLRLRCESGLRSEFQATVLPAAGADGSWLNMPQKTQDFAAAFRALLLKSGFDETDLDNLGAHSLKTTTLAWMARAGVQRNTRRLH